MNHYLDGSVRWHRYTGKGDVRAYRPPKGWEATAHLIDHHPITNRMLRQSQWWVREEINHGLD